MFPFDGTYDPEMACIVCCMYTDTRDRDLLQETLFQLAPLISLVAKRNISPSMGAGNTDILKADALEKVYFVLEERFDVPVDNHKSFTHYFWSVIYNSMIDSIKNTTNAQVFDYYTVASEPLLGTLCTHELLEMKMYAEQIEGLLLHAVTGEIRFTGNERKACIHIAKCMLKHSKLSPASARFKFKITKAKTQYLIQYVEILMRKSAIWIKAMDDSIGES